MAPTSGSTAAVAAVAALRINTLQLQHYCLARQAIKRISHKAQHGFSSIIIMLRQHHQGRDRILLAIIGIHGACHQQRMPHRIAAASSDRRSVIKLQLGQAVIVSYLHTATRENQLHRSEVHRRGTE
jgi:hypothetical protein